MCLRTVSKPLKFHRACSIPCLRNPVVFARRPKVGCYLQFHARVSFVQSNYWQSHFGRRGIKERLLKMISSEEDEIEIVFESSGGQRQAISKSLNDDEIQIIGPDFQKSLAEAGVDVDGAGPSRKVMRVEEVEEVACAENRTGDSVVISLPDFFGCLALRRSFAVFESSTEFRSSVQSKHAAVSKQVLQWRKWDSTPLAQKLEKAAKSPDQLPPNSVKFTIMSYNILCQQYLEDMTYLYKACPSITLCWEYRSKCLLDEISIHQPDILCMQEVQEEHFYDSLNPELLRLGYCGVFKKKTGHKVEGSAILFKTDLFDFVNHTEVEFFYPNVRLLDRENVGLIVQLTPKGKPEEDSFFVATTHLLYNPNRPDIRLSQLQAFFTELDRVAFCGVDSNRPGLNYRYKPVMLCGDFNFTPRSPVYDFVTRGRFRFEGTYSGSLTYRPRGTPLGHELLPSDLFITDNCQHATVARERLESLGYPEEILQLYGEDGRSYYAYLHRGQHPKEPAKPVTKRVVGKDFWKEDFIPLEPETESPSLSRSSSESSIGVEVQANGNQASPSKKEEQLVPPGEEDLQGNDEGEVQFEEVEDPMDDPNTRIKNPYGTGILTHNFDFRSVHRHRFFELPGQPYEVTTFQKRWITVDYIFYTVPYHPELGKRVENRLQLLGSLRLLNPEQSGSVGRMPNYGVPSDHYPVMAKFLLYLNSKEGERKKSASKL